MAPTPPHLPHPRQDAAAAGCRLLFLPECFGFIGDSPAQSLAAAQPLTGPLMDQYRQLARWEGAWGEGGEGLAGWCRHGGVWGGVANTSPN